MENQEQPVKKTNGNRNRNAGHQFERDEAKEWRDMGFPHVVTARVESKRRDDQKVDLMNKDEKENGRLPYNIQCKNCATSMPYPKLLAEMPKGGSELNVVIHNQTVKSGGGRFMTKGQYALMTKDDFYSMVKKIENLQIAFNLFNDMFDCIPREEQERINNELTALGL